MTLFGFVFRNRERSNQELVDALVAANSDLERLARLELTGKVKREALADVPPNRRKAAALLYERMDAILGTMRFAPVNTAIRSKKRKAKKR